LVWFGLVWFGLVWFGLVWFGLVWFGLVWFGFRGGAEKRTACVCMTAKHVFDCGATESLGFSVLQNNQAAFPSEDECNAPSCPFPEPLTQTHQPKRFGRRVRHATKVAAGWT
jgi:hypothetical protein